MHQLNMVKSGCEVFHPSLDGAEGFLHLVQVLFTGVVPLLLNLQSLLPLLHLQVTGKPTDKERTGLVPAQL